MAVLGAPRGLIIDLITPLKTSGDIDGRGLGQHLDRVLPHAQAVFIASPSMGEGQYLNPEQVEELFEKTLVVARGRVPVLVWISRDTEERTTGTLHRLKRRLEIRKYSGQVFWVDSPLFYHSNRGLPLHYRNLSSMVDNPFLLYNDPELIKHVPRPFKRANIRTGILKELARIDNIGGLVYRGDLDRAYHYYKAVRARSDFRIYDGDESYFLSHPSLSGVVSLGANLAPRAWQRITESSLNLSGDQKEYPDHLQQIWELGAYLQELKDLYQGSSFGLIKQVLADMEIIDSAKCTVDNEVTGQKIDQTKILMQRFGDYP